MIDAASGVFLLVSLQACNVPKKQEKGAAHLSCILSIYDRRSSVFCGTSVEALAFVTVWFLSRLHYPVRLMSCLHLTSQREIRWACWRRKCRDDRWVQSGSGWCQIRRRRMRKRRRRSIEGILTLYDERQVGSSRRAEESGPASSRYS